jgi:hypothetical protein
VAVTSTGVPCATAVIDAPGEEVGEDVELCEDAEKKSPTAVNKPPSI